MVDGREVPLLPVYVGRERDEGGLLLHVWVLYVHPGRRGRNRVDREPGLRIDVVPARSTMRLMMAEREDGAVIAVKHDG